MNEECFVVKEDNNVVGIYSNEEEVCKDLDLKYQEVLKQATEIFTSETVVVTGIIVSEMVKCIKLTYTTVVDTGIILLTNTRESLYKSYVGEPWKN